MYVIKYNSDLLKLYQNGKQNTKPVTYLTVPIFKENSKVSHFVKSIDKIYTTDTIHIFEVDDRFIKNYESCVLHFELDMKYSDDMTIVI